MNNDFMDMRGRLHVTVEPPVSCRKVSDGRWFVDFGKAMFGTVKLKLHASKAVDAEVCLGEKLKSRQRIDRNPPGHIRCRAMQLRLRKGTRSYQVEIPPDQRNTLPRAVLMPDDLFEVLPFRYVEIVAPAGEVTLEGIERLAVHVPFNEDASAFTCNDERLNKVWELCKHSIKATSFLGIYVDGDRERIAYEGDAYINQLSHYGVDAEYDTARRTFKHLLEHPTWPVEWILHMVPIAWADYWYSGDDSLLRQYYRELKSRLLLPLARRDHLISTKTGLVTRAVLRSVNLKDTLRDLVDWPPGQMFSPDAYGERDGYEMTDINTVVNAFHWWSLRLYAQTGKLLGRNADAKRYSKLASQVRAAMLKKLFDPTDGAFVDGEGSQHKALHATMFPAAFGMIPRKFQIASGEYLRSRGMACSVYGAQHLLEACYRFGMQDYALELMTAEHDRGWLNMLKAGSTVTLEAWDWKYKQNLDWNHAWGAAPANIIPRYVVGVQPYRAGFEAALVRPQPSTLTNIEAKVPTPHGSITVSYEKSGKKRKLTIESPVPTYVDLSALSGGAYQPRTLRAGLHMLEIT